MKIHRRDFAKVMAGGIASLAIAKPAMAATLTLGGTITLPKGTGNGVFGPSIAALPGGAFRTGFSPHDSFASWTLGITQDYTKTLALSGLRRPVGNGVFKSVNVSCVCLPTSGVVVYSEDSTIWLQALLATGAPSGARVQVATANIRALSLRAVALSTGNILVGWSDSSGHAIKGRVVKKTGAPVTAVISLAPGVQWGVSRIAADPTALCALPAGAFAVAFNTSTGAKFRRFHADGTVDGNARSVEPRTSNTVYDAGLFAMPNGDLLALHRVDGGSLSAAMTATRFTPAGAATVFCQFGIAGNASLGQEPPIMVKTAKGDLLMIGNVYDSGSRKIMAALFSSAGVAIGTPVTVFTSALSGGGTPHLAQLTDARLLTDGRIAIAWCDGASFLYKSYVRLVTPPL